MPTVNMHDAKTHLSRLVEQAVAGETVIIARAGTPIIKVSALDAPPEPRRRGFMAGEYTVPRDVDRMGEAEIAALFGLAD
ncbi:MAG: type II toxin-antitoxin system Phd/YefM family antitoxin [Gemmatimonas sp.]|jgi:prevent-host-death family protein|uniref:type II toxin-antitoxin system Phd/YefM family antitoxin n=1 Tax=Gemmatimonas sp. TaxID=1962908 RepID=UPI00391F5D24|nr:type II toxin-antitoxin system prevent-host-death family antitoxin [Gemmatimonadota bacterium]